MIGKTIHDPMDRALVTALRLASFVGKGLGHE
jgi:hypothetical protein